MNSILSTQPAKQDIEYVLKQYRSGNLALAKSEVDRFIKQYPNSSTLYNILGAILADQNKLNEAISNHRKALTIKPDYAEAYNNLGLVLKKIGKLDESIDNYQKAIKLKPDFAIAFNNLGDVFKEVQKFEEAIVHYKEAIKIKFDYAEAYKNLGSVFKHTGNFEESIFNYQQAIKYKADYGAVYNNLGNALKEMDRVDEAILNYEKAIEIEPKNPLAYNNLGNTFIEIGKIEKAKKCYLDAFKIDSRNVQYEINRALSLPPIINSVDELNLNRDLYLQGLENLKKYKFYTDEPSKSLRMNSFFLSYQAKNNLQIQKKTAAMFNEVIPNLKYISKNIKKAKDSNKIKLGFISEFLTKHTIGKLFGGLIQNLNRKIFEITIFHSSQTQESPIKEAIDRSANRVVKLKNKITEQRKQIEYENLDIIFYPDIGMSSVTYFLAFSRIAPVQIASIGHPETTGIDTIDYFLSSVDLETSAAQQKYTEKLILLENLPLYYEPPRNFGKLKSRKELKLPEDASLYVCPQSLFKLHPDFDGILERILIKDNKGYIVFIGGTGKYKYWSDVLKKRWSKKFSALKTRVLFLNRMSFLEFLSLCNCSNVMLDPVHFGGGNSVLETMLFGTPTITMPGEYLRGNVATAIYKQMKIKNPPIAKNPEEYANLAVELANNKTKNSQLREESKIAANKFLYKNSKALEECERFLQEVYDTEKKGNKIGSGYTIKTK